MAKKDEKPDPQSMNFEDALGELEGIVKELEAGETNLEGAINAYERGVSLKRQCEEKLREAQLRVEKIETDARGAATGTEPFDAG